MTEISTSIFNTDQQPLLRRHGLVVAWLQLMVGLLIGLYSIVSVAVTLQGDAAIDLDQQFEYLIVQNRFENPFELEQAVNAGQWTKGGNTTTNLLYQSSDVWVRVPLQVASGQAEQWIVELAWPFIDNVDAFWVTEQTASDRGVQSGEVDNSEPFARNGDHVPLSQRFLKHRYPVFLLPHSAIESGTLYLRISTGSSILISLSAWPRELYFSKETKLQAALGAFFGVMLIMALYNFGIWLFVRERSYLFYVAYTLVVSLYEASITGMGSLFLWGSSVWWSDHALVLSAVTSFIMAALFVNAFLDLKKNSYRTYNLVRMIVVTYCIFVVLVLFFRESTVAGIGQWVGIAVSLGAFYIGVKQWQRGNPAARYFTIAWTVLLLGTCTYTLMLSGYLPQNLFTESVQLIGIMLEVVLLSFALGERMNRERQASKQATDVALHLAKELNKAHEEKIKSQIEVNITLEKEVTKRTYDLKQAMDNLSVANEQLEALSQTDQLTGLKNRRYFDQCYGAEHKRCERNSLPISVLVLDIDFFKKINDNYGHLFGDECLKNVAFAIDKHTQRPGDIAVRYGGEEFIVLLPNTDVEGANLVAELIRKEVEAIRVEYDHKPVPITISSGVATRVPSQGEQPDSLIKMADDALYMAKENGRNRVEVA